MKRSSFVLLAVGVAIPAFGLARWICRRRIRRVGMVIGVRPDRITAYEALHAASNSGVRDLLTKYNIRNFSIYLEKLPDEKYYLFGYYEYAGRDFEADMGKLAAEPRNQAWLKSTDPMQIPMPGKDSWAVMREVYHNP
jgi:L-rhamnose mutarotase